MMRTQSIILIVSCIVLFTIVGVSCNYSKCTGLNIKCSNDGECCSQRCSYHFLMLESVCADNISLLEKITSYFVPKEQNGKCSYKVPSDKQADVELYNKYGLNAAHPVLSTNTKVEVIANNKKVLLTINNRQSSTKGSIIELSEEAAKVLDITQEGLFDCSVLVPVIENNTVLKAIQYVIPYLGLMILLRLV